MRLGAIRKDLTVSHSCSQLPISRLCQFLRHSLTWSIFGGLLFGISSAYATDSMNSLYDTPEQEIMDRSVKSIIQSIKNASSLEASTKAKDEIHGLIHQIEKSPLLMQKTSLCLSLMKIQDEELALIDAEIDEVNSSSILKPCAFQLQNRIDQHWYNQIAQLPEPYGFYKPAGRAHPQFVVTEKYLSAQNPGEYTGSRAAEGYNRKQLMLTFDDGPNNKTTPVILDILRERGAKAVFFSLGRNANRYPEVIQRVGAEGHAVGSHSCFHPSLGTWIGKVKTFDECPTFYKQTTKVWTLEDSLNEILNGHSFVFQSLGWIDPFFRFPHGDSTEEMKDYLAANGLHNFRWNIDSFDWQTTDVMTVVSNTLNKIKSQNEKGIVLFHDTLKQSALALPIILDQLAEEGFSLVLPVIDQPELRTENVPLVETHPQANQILNKASKIRYNKSLKRYQ